MLGPSSGVLDEPSSKIVPDTQPFPSGTVSTQGLTHDGRELKLSRRYSARNAVAGSTSAALSAGTTHARHAIEPSASVVTANVAVSCGCTP
jgi:hypothetical protein